MATGTKKSTTKKSTGRRRESAKAREARLRAQRQMRAIILMAVGLLFSPSLSFTVTQVYHKKG